MTKRLLPMTLVLAAALAGPARADDAADVLKRDDARVAAQLKADATALADAIAADATYTHSSSILESGKDFIDGVRTGRLKYKSYDRKEAAVALHGDTAVVTGKAFVVVVREGADVPLRLQFTNVWVKRTGKWRMVSWHSTRLPEN